jgi:hypothetical protein
MAVQRSAGTAADAGEVATGFYPLTYNAIPVTQGSIVRLELSPASLTALGVDPAMAGPQRSSVVADVLVGEDGLARAVRFVRVPGAN